MDNVTGELGSNSSNMEIDRQQRLEESRNKLVQRLCESRIELRPGGMDQHFMIDSQVLDELTESLDPSDVVLEIGAGIGILTERLCEKASKVYSVELDERFKPALDNLSANYDNLDVTWGDGLQVGIPADVNVVVANPPFAIMEPLLKKLSTAGLEKISLTMGEKTWRSIVSPLTSPDFTAMSLYVQSQYQVVKSEVVPNDAFYPAPGGKFYFIELESKRVAHMKGRVDSELSPQITAIMEQFASILINEPSAQLGRTLQWILDNNKVFNKSIDKYKDYSKIVNVKDLGIHEDTLKKAIGVLDNHEIRRVLTTLAGRVNRNILTKANRSEMSDEQEVFVLSVIDVKRAFGEISLWSGGEYADLEAEFNAAEESENGLQISYEVCCRMLEKIRLEKADPSNDYSMHELDIWQNALDTYIKLIEELLQQEPKCQNRY